MILPHSVQHKLAEIARVREPQPDGPRRALTHGFAVLGYHVTGSTGTLFLYGIVVGALAMLGPSLLLAGARRDLEQSRRETAAVS